MMGNSGTIILVVLILAGLFLWQSNPDNSSREAAGQFAIDEQETYSRGENVTDTNVTNTSTAIKNACGYTNFGPADYIGTQSEGLTCADAMGTEHQDNECVLNPPVTYNGDIRQTILYSNPILSCCVEDGSCQWN
jgi:hypothetical protein